MPSTGASDRISFIEEEEEEGEPDARKQSQDGDDDEPAPFVSPRNFDYLDSPRDFDEAGLTE
jgi:hypothetical protein